MFKRKARFFVFTFIIFVISFLFINNNYARFFNMGNVNDNEITNWKVKITADTKELEDIQEISFRVEDNENVVNGKIAPGMKAVAQIEIDITGTKYPVDISATIDDSNLYDCFKLVSKLDGEIYKSETINTIKSENSFFTMENGKRILILELEWKDNYYDTEFSTNIGENIETIKVPIRINVTQHIEF